MKLITFARQVFKLGNKAWIVVFRE